METAKLNIDEFLSIYTGLLLGSDVGIIYDGMEKIFGFRPATFSLVKCRKQFCKFVNENRPDIVESVEKLGKLECDPERDVTEQINEILDKYKNIIEQDYVEVEVLEYQNDFNMNL